MNSPETSAPRVETAEFPFLKFDSDGKRVVGVRDDPPSSFSIPLGVVEVGKDAFRESRIKTIKLPNSVKRIRDSAFRECRSLISVSLSDSLEKICDFAFQYCSSLSSITIPSSVTQIGNSAFEGCSSLSSITIPSSVTQIGNFAFQRCSSLSSITIPSSVTQIGNSAFWYCSSLSSITIPSSVTQIGNDAFYGCSSLSSITIPSSVTQIGESAFQGCSSLSSVLFVTETLNFRKEAFSECPKLKRILLPERIRSIQSDRSCGFSQSLRKAFLHYAVQFGENIKSVIGICEGFEGCVDIPEGVERIEKRAFEHSKISSIKLPKTLKYIGESAFANCNCLQSISIPNSVEFIGGKAFFGCFSLSGDISLPRQIHDIKDCLFFGCKNITSIRHNDINCCVRKDCVRVGFHKPECSIVIAGIFNLRFFTNSVGDSAPSFRT